MKKIKRRNSEEIQYSVKELIINYYELNRLLIIC